MHRSNIIPSLSIAMMLMALTLTSVLVSSADGMVDNLRFDVGDTQSKKPLAGSDKVQYADGLVSGSFVSVGIDPLNGTLSNYTLIGPERQYKAIGWVFIEDFVPSNVVITGSVAKAQSKDTKLMVHDNPTGMISIQVKKVQANISFELAAGMGVNVTYSSIEENRTNSGVLIEGQGIRGVISCNNGTIGVSTVGSTTFVNVTVNDGKVNVRFRPAVSTVDLAIENALLYAVLEDRIGGEVSASIGSEGGEFDAIEYDPDLQFTMDELRAGRLTFTVSASNHNGKAVIINLADNFRAPGDTFSIMMDDKSVKMAGSVSEVIHADRDGLPEPIFSMVEGDSASMVLLYVPNYSSHTVVIDSSVPTSDLLTPMSLALEVGAIVIIILAALYLFRKR